MWRNLETLLTKQCSKICAASRMMQLAVNLRGDKLLVKRLYVSRKISNFTNSIQTRKCNGLILQAGLLTYLGLQTEGKPKSAEEEVTDILKMAILAQQKGETKKAEQLLHLALKIAQEQLGPLAVTHIFDIMANFAMEAGDYPKAEQLFKEVLKRMLASPEGKMVSEESNAVIEISIKLADIYSASGRLPDAESGYDYCLKHLTAKMKAGANDSAATTSESKEDTTMLWAICNDSLGRHLIRVGKIMKAVEHFTTALDVCRKVNGPNHPATLMLTNNLGSANSMSGNNEVAIGQLKEAVRIAEVIGSPDLSAYQRNLGMIYLEMGRLAEASTACNVALKVATGDDREEALSCLEDIADMRRRAHKT